MAKSILFLAMIMTEVFAIAGWPSPITKAHVAPLFDAEIYRKHLDEIRRQKEAMGIEIGSGSAADLFPPGSSVRINRQGRPYSDTGTPAEKARAETAAAHIAAQMAQNKGVN